MIKLCIICLTLSGAAGGIGTALQSRSNNGLAYSAAAAERLNASTIHEALSAARSEGMPLSKLLTDEAL